MKRLVVFAAVLALAACSSGGEAADGGTGSIGSTGSSGSTGQGTTGGSSTSGGSSGGSTGSLDAISGLSGDVTVDYDANDVPHIHCGTFLDCVRVQGYIHAHDRFFEMDLVRRLAEGRLSELLGNSELANCLFLAVPRMVFHPHKALKDAAGRTAASWLA